MKKSISFLALVCTLSSSLARAAETASAPNTTTTAAAASPTKPLATKTVWARGLRAPQGMARDAAGNIYIAEFKGGQIAKFAPDGKSLGHVGTDLQSPAWLVASGDKIYVSERKANRVLKLQNGTLVPVGGAIEEPLGLDVDKNGRLVVISHTTSQLFALNAPQSTLSLIYKAPESDGKRYGYRCVAVDRDGSLLISDEIDGVVRLLTPAGRMTILASNLDGPTAMLLAGDGAVYVAEENAGRVVRLERDGSTTLIANGLGQPRDIEAIDAKMMLVSDRENGNIWQLRLP